MMQSISYLLPQVDDSGGFLYEDEDSAWSGGTTEMHFQNVIRLKEEGMLFCIHYNDMKLTNLNFSS